MTNTPFSIDHLDRLEIEREARRLRAEAFHDAVLRLWRAIARRRPAVAAAQLPPTGAKTA